MFNTTLQWAAAQLLHKQARFRGPDLSHSIELLPELIEMVAEQRAQPADHLRPAIRQLIAERAFACPADSLASPQDDHAIDAQTDLLVGVLETVRRRAVATGQWSENPAAPIMYG